MIASTFKAILFVIALVVILFTLYISYVLALVSALVIIGYVAYNVIRSTEPLDL